MDQTKEINEVLKLLPLILVLMLIIQGYWLVTTSLFPKFINNARSHYKKPIRTTLVGLAVIVPTFFLGFKFLANISNPIVQAIGFLIGILPIIAGIAGSAGLCQLIGYGLPSPTDQSQNWKRVWRWWCSTPSSRTVRRPQTRSCSPSSGGSPPSSTRSSSSRARTTPAGWAAPSSRRSSSRTPTPSRC